MSKDIAAGKTIRFKSRIGKLTVALMIFSIAIMLIPVIPLFLQEINLVSLLLIGFILSLSALLIWLVWSTGYEISVSHVVYYSGPIKAKIAIQDIHTIISGKTLWVGYKPATATKGIIVKYGKYDEIYFSPHTNERFIEELLKIKPTIEIIKT